VQYEYRIDDVICNGYSGYSTARSGGVMMISSVLHSAEKVKEGYLHRLLTVFVRTYRAAATIDTSNPIE
jgi:hypothetical protein